MPHVFDFSFGRPIGAVERPSVAGSDLVEYDSTTGELIYRSDHPSWFFPPDLLSKSGRFSVGVMLPELPGTDRPASWSFDEKIEGAVVAGSEAIRLNYLTGAIWPHIYYTYHDNPFSDPPFDIEPPTTPSMYSYGRVLPPGLTREFLLEDLYTTHQYMDSSRLVIVPEPTSQAMLAVALAVAVGRRRNRGRFQ